MHLDRVLRRIEELNEIALEVGEIQPASAQEIAAFEKKLGAKMPGAVREIYEWGGNEMDILQAAFVPSLQEQMRSNLLPDARAILEKAGQDPKILTGTMIVQMDYDGQFSFVRLDDGDDPAVMAVNERDRVRQASARFSDYIRLMIEQFASIEDVEYVHEVAALRKLKAHEVKQLMLGGDERLGQIPAEIFALKDLQALNLVGKGLLEISPRIAELAFLKRLDLARNSISTLPMVLMQLDELEELDLADNLISDVDLLQRMPALKWVSLRGNPIDPERLEQLQDTLEDVEIIS
jgi:hypothetical protein